MRQEQFLIERATNYRIVTTDGREYIDLVAGFGAVFLGHCEPLIQERLTGQLSRCWATGRFDSTARIEALEAINSFIAPKYSCEGFYSTGMEATEFAMRVAAATTGHSEFVGFNRSMHGKSGFAAALGWDNAALDCPQCHRLPFVDEATADEILDRLDGILRERAIAAVFVEPVHGSGAAWEAPPYFYDAVIALCEEHGTLSIFDEYLTGFYRTGRRFYCDGLKTQPDVVIFAKSLGNGFPVSAVALKKPRQVPREAFPGSTFSGNPLAAAAVSATLERASQLDLGEAVGAIEHIVRVDLGGELQSSSQLRGCGALWAVELPDSEVATRVRADVARQGVLVSSAANFLRLTPMATIDTGDLQSACMLIAAACNQALADRAPAAS